ALETEGGVGHFADIEELGCVFGLMIFGEGKQEGGEHLLVFTGKGIDPGEEIMLPSVLGGASLAGLAGRSVTLPAIDTGSLLLRFGADIVGFHEKPPFICMLMGEGFWFECGELVCD
ncbi:MAG: hypothetical protein JNL62_21930, partial [Bryobacterales bacterium]|nr:hypothetical protein [Bryobacterales bacterium]